VVQRFQLHTDIIRSPRRLYGKICKYFGINTVEELIRFRQETFNNRYGIVDQISSYVTSYDRH